MISGSPTATRFFVPLHRRILLCGLLLSGFLGSNPYLIAQERDTLSLCRPSSGYVYFRNPDLELQAARFVNPAPGYLREVSVCLGGSSADGTARLRLFGHEGGVPAPVLEEDLIEPILLRKSKPGFERITVAIPGDLFLENNQFFVALDQLDSGVLWLSDQVEKAPFCSSGEDIFYYQLLKERQGWRWEKFSFAVDAVMDYPATLSPRPMGDVAYGMGIADTVRRNRSIAWGDVNRDGYLDLLWDGRLYLNREGKRFDPAASESGLSGSPAANIFLDANNDGHLDILFVGLPDPDDSTVSRGRLFLADADATFRSVDLEIAFPENPTSLNAGDIDGDGFLDLFVGSTSDSVEGGRLLLNSSGTGFRDATESLLLPDMPDLRGRLAASGSQFIDADRDGDLDLYIARRYPQHSLLLYNDGAGRFQGLGFGGTMTEFGSGSGGDWKDFDNDGDPDLLYPRLIHPWLHKYRGLGGSGIYLNDLAALQEGKEGVRTKSEGGFVPAKGVAGADMIAYEERHAGGAWGDVNNDGLLDAFFATAGECRFAELYTQNRDHTFSTETFEYGLHWSGAGLDGVWVDFDNDGWMDLCAIEWGRLRLYKNPGDGGHSRFVEIDPVGPKGGHDIGAVVTVFSGGERIDRDVTAGRGLLMEDPPRLHYGLGPTGNVDSVLVRWSDGASELFTGLQANAIHSLVKGSSGNIAALGEASISAVPNPFSSELHIHFHLGRTQTIRLEIYDRSGGLVKTLAEGEVAAGEHTVVWTGTDGAGRKVSSGVYLYRLVFAGGEVSGRAVFSQ